MGQPTTYDLGADVAEVEFKISGQTFTVFPWDELEAIHHVCSQSAEEPKGEAFWKICRAQLATHGVKASLQMAGRWYSALTKAHEEQLGFFDESPASSGSTDTTPAGDDSKTSVRKKTGSSNSRKTASKRKS